MNNTRSRIQLNKYIFILIIALVACNNKSNVIKSKLEGQLLPSFQVFLLDSTSYFTNNISKQHPTVFLFFSSSCPYCKAQTVDIVDNIKDLTDINFYFIATDPIPTLLQYSKYYELNKIKNITVIQDYKNFFHNYFNTMGVPYLAVYNKKKILKQVFMGKTNVYDLKEVAIKD